MQLNIFQIKYKLTKRLVGTFLSNLLNSENSNGKVKYFRKTISWDYSWWYSLHHFLYGHHPKLSDIINCRRFSTFFQPHRRCIMKVQQAVDFHLQYHKANSKKKYSQDLWVCLTPLCRSIWQTWFSEYLTGRDSYIPDVFNQRQQTGHEKKPIFGAFIFLQFQHQYSTTSLNQSLQLSYHQKDIQAPPSHSMANCG